MELLGLKAIWGTLALLLTFAAFYPYIRDILNERIRPHVFSWVIWGIGTLIVFAAQWSEGGGIGAGVVGVSSVITLFIAFLAWQRRGDITISAMDWSCLGFAIIAVILWAFSRAGLSAVIILTCLDLIGFLPSIRKGYHEPWKENASLFAIGAVRNLCVIFALEAYNWTTVLFPAAIGVACVVFVAMLLFRRRKLKPEALE